MRGTLAVVCLALLSTCVVAQAPKEADRAAKWEKEIAAIEKRLTEKPPDQGGIVFSGSSTIRMWDVSAAFPKATNCGFGGSEIRDVTHFADRIILKHEPRAIIFYSGDNDLNSRRTPEQVVSDFKALAEVVHNRLPKTRIYFISIKPSLARWKQFDAQSKANALVKELCEKNERLGYVDIVPKILGSDGQPRAELFVKDGLHLSKLGYEILNDAVRKTVK
jgi:lysophospholipase L1-like esterase